MSLVLSDYCQPCMFTDKPHGTDLFFLHNEKKDSYVMIFYTVQVDTSFLDTHMNSDLCVYVTYRWESDDRSLKAPSGISDMSLPWRDLRKGDIKRKEE